MSHTHHKILELSLYGNTMYEIPMDLWVQIKNYVWIMPRGRRYRVKDYLEARLTIAERKRIRVITNYKLPEPKNPEFVFYDEWADWSER